MRFDLLRRDILRFQKYFPAENYDANECDSRYCEAENLEEFLEKGWNAKSGVKLNFLEALVFHRFDNPFNYSGSYTFSHNGLDSETIYDDVFYKPYVLDSLDKYSASRHASSIYNLPLRMIEEIGFMSTNKDRQCEYALNYIDKLQEG